MAEVGKYRLLWSLAYDWLAGSSMGTGHFISIMSWSCISGILINELFSISSTFELSGATSRSPIMLENSGRV